MIVAFVTSLSACSWNKDRSAKLGGATGGIVGGIAGSTLGRGKGAMAAAIIGATLGAMWGEDIARGMTDSDKIFAERTTKDTLEYEKSGKRVTWSNPDSGNSGDVTANTTYQNDKGENCRDFETTAEIEGENRVSTGTACRLPSGEWKVVEEST